ncbi:hypothetical protein ACIRP3_03100 [Streptomyces sp. NPDC101209]|uniref:hypothetical protein n=1 Tax=Streptomyces sp. NPDC101209 TaxID=3366129 RepID=UPI0037FE32F8
MRKLGRLALVFAAFAALFGLQQGNAYALEATCFTADGDAGGKSCYIWHEDSSGHHVDSVKFDALGEYLTITDLVANGEGVAAYVNGVRYPGQSAAYGPVQYNLSIADGTSVKLESCQTDNGKEYDCHTEWAVA